MAVSVVSPSARPGAITGMLASFAAFEKSALALSMRQP